MKKLFILIVLILGLLIFMAAETTTCYIDRNTADMQQQNETEKLMQEVNSQLGMPNIINFQEKKLAKMIFELRDQEDLITYAYIVNMQGSLIFLGKCLGFGLPYSVQYTNPEKIIKLGGSLYSGSSPETIPQPDPNGLFMPQGLSATWLMMIDGEGIPRPVYIEPQIIVSPFKLH